MLMKSKKMDIKEEEETGLKKSAFFFLLLYHTQDRDNQLCRNGALTGDHTFELLELLHFYM